MYPKFSGSIHPPTSAATPPSVCVLLLRMPLFLILYFQPRFRKLSFRGALAQYPLDRSGSENLIVQAWPPALGGQSTSVSRLTPARRPWAWWRSPRAGQHARCRRISEIAATLHFIRPGPSLWNGGTEARRNEGHPQSHPRTSQDQRDL